MKCINRALSVLIIIALSTVLFGCSKEISSPYDVFATSKQYGLIKSDDSMGDSGLFSADLCVSDGEDIGTDKLDNTIGESAAVFNISSKEILYSQNMYKRIYPASTTKVLTAYLAFKYGNMEEPVTVSEHACDQKPGSGVCKLNPGDVLTLRQLTYGLLIKSGNDAAIAIAEAISGSEEAFAELMNKEARALGATHSHFVNPNGLHDDDHYSCAYDMYLIFNEAIKYGEFLDIVSQSGYSTVYKDASGQSVTNEWESTNRYLTGESDFPEELTLIGGKTGTTWHAGYCLVILSKNSVGEEIISMVFKADTQYDLYEYMSRILTTFV